MTRSEATAEVFLTAFRALPKRERDAVVVNLVKDRGMRRDLIDLAVIEERRTEPSRPFRSYLKSRSRG